MSKKSTIPAIPDIYQGLDRSPRILKLCLVEDVHGAFFLYKTSQEINVVKEAQHKVWFPADEFMDENKATITTYHDNLFKQAPDKKQDLVTTAVYCIYKMASIATNRAQDKAPTSADGRKSSILTSRYFPGKDENGAERDDTGTLKTPQALASIRLFRACLTEKRDKQLNDPAAKDLPIPDHVTEAELRQYVVDHADQLRTRQDPWRIFQYYRANLISERLIRRD